MSLLEELFGVDEAEEAEALERIIEGGSEHDDEPAGDPDDEAVEDKRTVDPSKPKTVRVVKHPQVVLNAARLTGPRGLQVIPEHFKDFRFKGKGHEKEDLDLILKKLEHWTHRLYPRFNFDDCLKKIESIGNKRPVLVMMRKIRSDQMVSTDEIVDQRDSSDEETAPVDEFDLLLQQQIESARETPRAGTTPLAPNATSSPSINEEQKMRMLRNKQLAEERRKKKAAGSSDADKTDPNQFQKNSDSIDLTGIIPLENTVSLTEEHSENLTNIDLTSNAQNRQDTINIDLTNTQLLHSDNFSNDHVKNTAKPIEVCEVDLTATEDVNKLNKKSPDLCINQLNEDNQEKGNKDIASMETDVEDVSPETINDIDMIDVRAANFSSDENSDEETPAMNITVVDVHRNATQNDTNNENSEIDTTSNKTQSVNNEDPGNFDNDFDDDF